METEMKNETKKVKRTKRENENFPVGRKVIVSGIFLNLVLLVISCVLNAQTQIGLMQILRPFGE